MANQPSRSLRAEATGSVAESTVRSVLVSRGYEELSVQAATAAEPAAEQGRLFGGATSTRRPDRYAVRQFPIGPSIYGSPLYTDVLVHGAPGFPRGLAIEVKWQQSQGSVDEKFPYLLLNIQECYPCPAIVIADGGGQRPGALHWLRGQVGGNLVAVYSLAEFLAWANRNL